MLPEKRVCSQSTLFGIRIHPDNGPDRLRNIWKLISDLGLGYVQKLSHDAKSSEASEELEEPMLIFQVLEDDTIPVLLLGRNYAVTIYFFQDFHVLEYDANFGQSVQTSRTYQKQKLSEKEVD